MANRAEKAIIVGGGILALSLVGTCSDKPAEFVAEKVIAGQMPPEPARIDAKRGAIHIAIGIDETRSDVSAQIPIIVKSTSSFLQGDTLTGGDTVNFCDVAGKTDNPARCTTYTLDADKEGLITAVEGTKAVEPGSDLNFTRINAALRVVVKGLEAPCAVGVWTDAIEMGKDIRPVNPETCDVKVLIPDAKYEAGAKEVCSHVKGDCDVVLAKTGEDLEVAFKGMTAALQEKAQAEADIIAERKHGEDMVMWEAKKAQILKDMQGIEEKIAFGIRTITGILGVLGASIATYILRPKCSGYLYISKGKKTPTMIALDGYDSKTVDISATERVVAQWRGGMQFNGGSFDGDKAQTLDRGRIYYSPTLLKGQEKIDIYKGLQQL